MSKEDGNLYWTIVEHRMKAAEMNQCSFSRAVTEKLGIKPNNNWMSKMKDRMTFPCERDRRVVDEVLGIHIGLDSLRSLASMLPEKELKRGSETRRRKTNPELAAFVRKLRKMSPEVSSALIHLMEPVVGVILDRERTMRRAEKCQQDAS